MKMDWNAEIMREELMALPFTERLTRLGELFQEVGRTLKEATQTAVNTEDRMKKHLDEFERRSNDETILNAATSLKDSIYSNSAQNVEYVYSPDNEFASMSLSDEKSTSISGFSNLFETSDSLPLCTVNTHNRQPRSNDGMHTNQVNVFHLTYDHDASSSTPLQLGMPLECNSQGPPDHRLSHSVQTLHGRWKLWKNGTNYK